MTEPEKFKLGDLKWGLVIPLIIGIVIIAFPAIIRPALDSWFPPGDAMGVGASPYAFLTPILTHTRAWVVMLGVPLFLGLTWNKWAGGAAGFVTGTLYYIASAGWNIFFSMKNYGIEMTPNLYGDASFISLIVNAILIGYIAGALNKKSMRIKRMLGASLTASITVGVVQYVLINTVAYGAWMASGSFDAVLKAVGSTILPALIAGIIVPFIARISAGSELTHF